MRLIALLVLTMLLMAPSKAHPLHLSITNITYENGKLDIRMKSFRDDWEVGYFHFHGKQVDFTDREQREIPWFNEYLNRNFRISTVKEAQGLNLEIDSIFLEDDAMTIEMHAVVPSSPNSLYIYNALLTDIYPDQTNLLIFGFNEKETGMKFDIKKHSAEVVLK